MVPAFFVLPTPPRSVPGRGLGSWVIKGGSGLSLFRVFSFLVLPIPPARSRGRSGYFGYSDCGTGLCDFLFSLFRWYTFASPPSIRLWRYFGFLLFRPHILTPPPLSGDMAVVFLDVFPDVPYA